jgi:hypothetical protein
VPERRVGEVEARVGGPQDRQPRVVGDGAEAARPVDDVQAGATLMVMIYAGGHISGGVFNPQVALGGATAGLAAGLAFLALNPGHK